MHDDRFIKLLGAIAVIVAVALVLKAIQTSSPSPSKADISLVCSVGGAAAAAKVEEWKSDGELGAAAKAAVVGLSAAFCASQLESLERQPSTAPAFTTNSLPPAQEYTLPGLPGAPTE
jgi:hypothetical protein